MSDQAAGLTVTLGARDYRIVPQPIGRIRRKLVKVMQLAEGEGVEGEIDFELHDVLRTFIPDLAPLWELLGFASQEAYDAGEEPADEAYDGRSPTLPQIIETVEAVYTVNGADRLVRLGKGLVGEDLVRTLLRKELIGWSSRRSSSSPSPSGTSTPMSSTPSTPTAGLSVASPSPGY